MTKIKKIVTLALGFILSIGTIGIASSANNSRTNKVNALEHDPLYNTNALYWENNSILPGSGSVSLLDASTSREDCHLDWSGEPGNHDIGIEVHSRTSFNVFNAVYVTFAFPVNVPAYTKQTLNFQWDFSVRRESSDSIGAYCSAELFYLGAYGVDYRVENNVTYYHEQNTNNTTGSTNSLYRLATNKKNTTVYGSYDDNRIVVDNTTDAAKDFYLYFGFFTYCDGVSTTTQFSSMCGIRAKSTNNKDFPFKVGDQFFTTLTEACSYFSSSDASSIILLKNYNCKNESITINKTGSLDLNGHKIIRPNYTVDPLFTVTKSGTVLNLKSSATGGYIEIDYGQSVFNVNTSATLHIVDDITIKSTSSSSSNSVISLVDNGVCIIDDGHIIGNRNGIIITHGILHINGGIIECAYNNSIVMSGNSSKTATSKLYISGSTALIKGNICVNSIIRNYIYLKNYDENIYYTPTNATLNIVGIDGSFKDVKDSRPIVFYYSNTTATVNVEEVPGFKVEENASGNLEFKTRIYTVTPKGDLFTISGTTEFTYLKDGGITFTVALKEAGELRRIDVKAGYAPLVEETDYVYSTETGVVTVYSSALKDDLYVSIYRIAEHVIIFDANGGKGEMEPITYKTGDSVTIPECTFALDYYYFKEWNTKADGTGIKIRIEKREDLDSDYTLYAIWEQNSDYKAYEFEAIYLYIQQRQADLPIIENPIDITNNDYTGACAGEDGFYAIAKAAFALLDDSTKNTLMSTNGMSHHKAARERFLAWAAANGETYDPTTMTFVAMANPYSEVATVDFTALLVISICTLGGGLVLVLFKKKHN